MGYSKQPESRDLNRLLLYVHSSIVHNGHQTEGTQVPRDGGPDKMSVHTAKYHLPLKTNGILSHAMAGMNLEDINGKCNKPNTTRQILCDFTYMRFLQESNSQRQKVEG